MYNVEGYVVHNKAGDNFTNPTIGGSLFGGYVGAGLSCGVG
jgi:hypothetical protein